MFGRKKYKKSQRTTKATSGFSMLGKEARNQVDAAATALSLTTERNKTYLKIMLHIIRALYVQF